MDERIHELEELVRAQVQLQHAMYDGDSEAGWPTESYRLLEQYEQKYNVVLQEQS